jgi:hypothetical protein
MGKVRDELNNFLHDSDLTVWSTAAVTVTLDGKASPELQRAAVDVLRALRLEELVDMPAEQAAGLAAQAAAPVHQVASVMRGEGQLWEAQSDHALIAQGEASRIRAAEGAKECIALLAGLPEAFASGASMLDVGTGVGAMAVAYAELFPSLRVVGIDVLPRVLVLAEKTVAASSAKDRIELREQDVSSLEEPDTYALAWLPAPFIPESALDAGVRRVFDALVPGAWMIVGHGKYGGDPLADAVGRFKTVAYGGTALDNGQAQAMLRGAGLGDVTTLPSPAGAPALTVGRKPGPS